jgi:hypothetical protein
MIYNNNTLFATPAQPMEEYFLLHLIQWRSFVTPAQQVDEFLLLQPG